MKDIHALEIPANNGTVNEAFDEEDTEEEDFNCSLAFHHNEAFENDASVEFAKQNENFQSTEITAYTPHGSETTVGDSASTYTHLRDCHVEKERFKTESEVSSHSALNNYVIDITTADGSNCSFVLTNDAEGQLAQRNDIEGQLIHSQNLPAEPDDLRNSQEILEAATTPSPINWDPNRNIIAADGGSSREVKLNLAKICPNERGVSVYPFISRGVPVPVIYRGVLDGVAKPNNGELPEASSEDVDKIKKKQCDICSPLRKWVQSANFYLYLTHFLSAWGDRMWAFGVGLFLVNIASHDLQLPAIYGLSSSITIFFLGALIGDWVDSTSRLKAAVLSLFLQNVFVVICAGGVYAFLFFDGEIRSGERSEWLLPLCQGGIILLAILSMLASLARHIAVERDWVVQICGKDKDRLATMTSSLRRIDQVTLILAPIATGQVMTFAGLRNGAVFIAGWNVFSLFVEYALLLKVYKTVPALSGKKGQSQPPQPPAEQEEPGVTEQNLKGQDEEEGETANVALTSVSVTDGDSEKVMTVPDGTNVDTETGDVASNVDADAAQAVGDSKKEQTDKEEPAAALAATKKKAKCERVLSRVLVLYRGWRTYMRYSVALAGIALACLYMTVLGFDNITVAYATTQGVSESVLGILMGASAVFGILGTFGYPALRHRVGSVRTGIFALSAQVSCLTLCLVSIWMPGSPFDPLYYMRPPPKIPVCSNATSMAMDVQTNSSSSTGVYVIDVSTSAQPLLGSSNVSNVSDCTVVPKSGPDSYLSVALLMAGIVLSRFGLWVADLTITQLFLEEVQEKERGIVSGVQSSLNQIMSVLKFVLVVAFPDVATFGYLIILSFCFICLGWVFYAVFLRRTRGHFFHFEKCKCGNGYNVPQTVTVHEPPVPPPPPKAQPQQAETAT